jgi:hypothetical protein
VTRDEKLTQIAVLWAENLSTRLISKRLSVTKNVVCGAVGAARHRGDSRFPIRKRTMIICAIRKDAGLKRAQPKRMPRVKPRLTPEPRPIVVEPAPKREWPVQLFDLRVSDCRFPVWSGEERGEHRFCAGLRAPGSSYCERHREQVQGSWRRA